MLSPSISSDKQLHELARRLFRQKAFKKASASLFTHQSVDSATYCLTKSALSSFGDSVSTVSQDHGPHEITREDIARIRSGLELRTTLMIKKVPRKYSLDTLRHEIDSVLTVGGCYDLLYLPVDSAKMTNRGYAFINFISPKWVDSFVRGFKDRAWSELNRRNKTAAVHWAYVQGRDATLAHIKTNVYE